MRRTTEAAAVVLAGVGALFAILAPKILRAKQELEGKALVGPSAVTGPNGSGDALFGVGGAEMGGGDGEEGAPRTSTPSGVSLVNGGGGGGGGSGGGGGGDGGNNKRRSSGRRRRALARGVSGSGNVGGIHIPTSLMGGSAKSTHTVSPDVTYEGGKPEIPPPLPPAEAAAFAAATTAAALQDRNSHSSSGSGKSKQRHLLDQPKPKAPPAASVICSRPQPGGGGQGGGNFATTGGAAGRKLLPLPDPSAFVTPPRRVRRSRSSAEISTRSADAMAKAAAAAGAAERKGSGDVIAPAFGGDRRHSTSSATAAAVAAVVAERRSGSRKSTSRKSSGSHRKSNRDSGGGAGKAPAERRGGGSGSTNASAKPPLSGASGSSRASRASSRGRSSRSHSHSHPSTTKTSQRSSGAATHKQAASTSGGSVGGDSNSVISRDSCSIDPFVMMLNGHFGMGGLRHPSAGHHHSSQKRKSSGGGGGGGGGAGGGGGGGQRGSGRWSTGSRKRGLSSERPTSMGSSSQGERRSSHPGSLVMFPERGTTLYCPHCDMAVAGCGFRGCSGSLVRAPSDDEDFGRSDDDELFGPEDFVPPPQPPPLLAKLGPHIGGESYISAGVGGGSGLGGGSSVASGSQYVPTGNIMSPSAQTSASMLGGSAQAHVMAAHTAAATALPPAHRNLSTGAASRLRMSFRRGPSPCDRFDDDDDDDVGVGEGDESQRSNLGIYSPTSSSAWA